VGAMEGKVKLNGGEERMNDISTHHKNIQIESYKIEG